MTYSQTTETNPPGDSVTVTETRPKESRLARNTILNVAGQVIPLLVGIVTIPYVVRSLGTARFGILSIAWLVFGYFSLLDLGLGRATTKFLAEHLARCQMERIPGLFWTSLALQAVFGIVGALMVMASIPSLVGKILKVPPGLVTETRTSLLLLAAFLPVVLTTNSLRSVLEAAQRFDLVNLLKVPGTISVFLAPAIGLKFGLQLPGIFVLLGLARIGLTIAHFIYCFRVFPSLTRGIVLERAAISPLLRFGGWVTAANVINPVLLYMDRFLVGSLLSLDLLTYYAVPFEIVTKLWVIPAGLSSALFPAFSGLAANDQQHRLEFLYARSFKYLLLVLGPIVLLLVAFSKDILTLWIGPDFAAKSAMVLQILALGVFANCFAHVPFSLLQSMGRPDTAAKILMFEFPLYFGLAWFMISRYGIRGAALAWAIRVTVEVIAFMAAASSLFSLSPRVLVAQGLLRSSLAVVGLAIGIVIANSMPAHAWALRATGCGLLIVAFGWAVWHHILDGTDRVRMHTLLKPLLRAQTSMKGC